MDSTLAGTFAGFVATFPMSACMAAYRRTLPPEQQYSLPPREITMEMARKAGALSEMDEPERDAATIVNHFGYGAVTGAVYGSLTRVGLSPGWQSGVGYGLAVWAGSYLGLMPALGMHPPATREPKGRNLMMIASHIVWGAALGLVAKALLDRRRG